MKVTSLGSVGSASSSSVKALRPLPVVVKAKSCALSGNASLVIVIEAVVDVFVKVQDTSAPGVTVMVAVRGGNVDERAAEALEAGERPAG